MHSREVKGPLRIGARNSPMALSFAGLARRAIFLLDPSLSIEIGSYPSFRVTNSISPYCGKRTFVNDLEVRLLKHEIDIAVHSLKDIPGDVAMHEDLDIGAYLPRHNPYDCLVLRSGVAETDLRVPGAVIGTSSPRRQAFLRRCFPESYCMNIQGNVNTRLNKLEREKKFHALVLSAAGLVHLCLEDRITRWLLKEEMMPALGQGTICLQIRCSDRERFWFLSEVNDPDTAYCSAAERQILSVLEGSCQSAIAGLCLLDHGRKEAHLTGMVLGKEGDVLLTAESRQGLACSDPSNLGELVGASLLSQGARTFLGPTS